MHIVVDELVTSLSVDYTILNEKEIYCIRPHLYIHNDPAGSLKMSIIYNSTTIASKTMTIADIKTNAGIVDDYFHGYITFQLEDVIHLGVATYTFKLEGVGYTYDSAAYVGWIREHEDLINEIGYTPEDYTYNPLSMQFWTYQTL